MAPNSLQPEIHAILRGMIYDFRIAAILLARGLIPVEVSFLFPTEFKSALTCISLPI
jgi:hypothetical protein